MRPGEFTAPGARVATWLLALAAATLSSVPLTGGAGRLDRIDHFVIPVESIPG